MSGASMFLPGDVQTALQNLLSGKLADVSVGSIGDLATDENGELIFDPPCARTFFAGLTYQSNNDNLALTYDDCAAELQIWCAAENLRSLEDQRMDTLALVAQVLPVVAGARLTLADESDSEPIRLVRVEGSLQGSKGAPVKTVYMIVLEVPGIAQFPPHEGE